jgi:hypothetical protein
VVAHTAWNYALQNMGGGAGLGGGRGGNNAGSKTLIEVQEKNLWCKKFDTALTSLTICFIQDIILTLKQSK